MPAIDGSSPTCSAGTASLAAHRSYLEALDDRPAEEQAREWIERAAAFVSGRFGGVPAVGFEIIGR